MIYRIICLLLIIITVKLYSQQNNAGSIIPADTSFTNYSAAAKVYKKFPKASLALAESTNYINLEENITFVSYGKRELKLDMYYPNTNERKLYPAVLFVHGGGWRSGDRSQERALAQKLSECGYVSVLADYRLSIEAFYPAAVYDLKAAVRWARANAGKYNIDTNKIAILGCSAGGQLATLVGNTSGINYLEGNSGNLNHSSAVQAIVNIDGLVDFTDIESIKYDTDSLKPSAARLWFGASYKEKPELWKEASPINYVSKNSAPILFINSVLEHYHAGSDEMIEKLKEFNKYYEVHTISDTPHPFWLFHPWFEETFGYIVRFLDKTFMNSEQKMN